jgi:hypothetical protein
MAVDRVLGLGAACLAGLVLVTAGGYGVGSFVSPGAGFWPFYIALAMLGLAAGLIARPAPDGSAPDQPASRWGRFQIALASLAFYVLALEWLGYLLTTAVLLFVQLRWVEDRSWRGSLLTAIVAAVVSLIVFRTLLKTPLPLGILPLPQGW